MRSCRLFDETLFEPRESTLDVAHLNAEKNVADFLQAGAASRVHRFARRRLLERRGADWGSGTLSFFVCVHNYLSRSGWGFGGCSGRFLNDTVAKPLLSTTAFCNLLCLKRYATRDAPRTTRTRLRSSGVRFSGRRRLFAYKKRGEAPPVRSGSVPEHALYSLVLLDAISTIRRKQRPCTTFCGPLTGGHGAVRADRRRSRPSALLQTSECLGGLVECFGSLLHLSLGFLDGGPCALFGDFGLARFLLSRPQLVALFLGLSPCAFFVSFVGGWVGFCRRPASSSRAEASPRTWAEQALRIAPRNQAASAAATADRQGRRSATPRVSPRPRSWFARWSLDHRWKGSRESCRLPP